jgi:hypothetical protein
MKYRLLAVAPFVLVPLLFAITAIAPSGEEGRMLSAANEIGKGLGVAGAIAAMLAFERGEYMWRAYGLFGLCYVLLLGADATGLAAPSTAAAFGGGVLVVLANALSVGSTWMLARAWNVAGFEDDASARSRKRRVQAVLLVIVLLITVWPLVTDVPALLRGEPAAIVAVGSDLGDMFTLALIAPVMLTAIAMRGGLLLWPWGLMTAGSLSWLVYDVTSDAIIAAHVDHGPLLVGSESIRLLAGGLILAAGLSQRMVLAED